MPKCPPTNLSWKSFNILNASYGNKYCRKTPSGLNLYNCPSYKPFPDSFEFEGSIDRKSALNVVK
jgi:hypothetical protein